MADNGGIADYKQMAIQQTNKIPEMRSSADLDPRRKRILFRAWHRGTKEMDLVLGRYADAALADLNDEQLDQLEALMQAPDPEIYKWLSGEHDVPENWDSPIVTEIRSFHLNEENRVSRQSDKA